MPFTSSYNGSFAGGRRASTTTFAGLAKAHRIIVHYDPSDASSYSGSGTTLSDLTSNNYDGTIVGEPTFDTNHFSLSANDYFVTPDISSDIPGDLEYSNGAIINVTGDGSDFFKREVTTNGVRIMGAGTVGGQTAVPDAWLEKVARMVELFTDPNGAGINKTYQRELIKTLSGDTGTYHAGFPTIQRVARGAGADYSTNFLTDSGAEYWNLTDLYDNHVQNDMVWYLNSTGDGYGDGDIDAQEVIEHIFHTLHMHGLPAEDIKLYPYISSDWASGDLYAAMEEAYDDGKWDPSGYNNPSNDWKTNGDAFEVAAKEYLFLLNFAMFEYTELWENGSLSPEWTDDMRTQAGIQTNNPLGYAFHNTYIAPVISKPSLATIRSIFQDGNTPDQDNPELAGAPGYVVDASVADKTHTVELWFYPTGDNGVLVQYQGQSAPNSSYHFSGIEMVSGQLEFGLWNGSGLSSSGPTGAVSLNTWHQVVMSYDGSYLRGFLDGVRVCKTAVTFDSPSDGSGSETGAFHLAVGPDTVINQGDGSDFEGRVGIFRVYKAKLNRSAVQRNYNTDKNTHSEPSSAWDPSTDITPALWYDASDTSSYTLSGSTLSTVTDKAGNFTPTVNNTPTRVTGGLNSLDVWDFDGSGENITTGSGPYASSGNHWAVGVFQWHTTDQTKDSFWSASGTRTYAVSSSQSNNTWTGEIDYDGSNSIVTGVAKNDFTASIAQNTWVIVSIVFNKTGNQIFGRLDGTTSTTVDAYNLSMDTTATDVRMMRNRGGVHLDGRMAEYFHVAGAPGTGSTDISDVQKAEGYLAHKWGLEGNLPVSHPYKSSAP
jgi:hypothetical protein